MAPLIELLFVTCFSLAVSVGAENVTTLFELLKKADETYDSTGTWFVVARGSARGLPLMKGHQGVDNVWAGERCCDSWTRTNWLKLNLSAANASNPPLIPEPFELIKLYPTEDRNNTGRIQLDNDSVWRAPFTPSSRVRLTFTPPKSGRAALGIFLCEPQNATDSRCTAIVLTGSSADGKLLRFQVVDYGPNNSGTRRPTPDGPQNTSVQYRDDSITEGWPGNNVTYNFHIERTSQGKMEVRLEHGDPSQRQNMSFSAAFTFNRLEISLLPATSQVDRFKAKYDPAWTGELARGKSIQVNFKSSEKGQGHLGFALCEDRFQERCTSVIFDGFSSGKAKVANSPYWTPGSDKLQHPIPKTSMNETWEPIEQRLFSVNRDMDGNVGITVSGDTQTYSFPLPPTQLAKYPYLVIENYDDVGSMEVLPQKESFSADVWQLMGKEGVLLSPVIPEKFVERKTCISLVARIPKSSSVVVTIQRAVDGEGKRVAILHGIDDDPQWIKKRLLLDRSLILQNQTVQIVLEAQQPTGTQKPILLQWLAACDPDVEEDRITVNGLPSVYSLADKRGFKTIEYSAQQLLPLLNDSVCANEGLFEPDTGRCLCRPGFSGKLCETNCGGNAFGENCAGRCTKTSFWRYSHRYRQNRKCGGMFLCTAEFPCECGPSLTGPRCDQSCPNGFYGQGCRQKCGECFENYCAAATGMCISGCQGGLQPPLCKEVCGSAKEVTSLIVQGTEVAAEKYPWHVAIFDKEHKNKVNARSNETTIENVCGGTILTRTIVISAAHCFHNDKIPPQKHPASKYLVAFGKTLRELEADEEHNERVQKRNVLEIHTPQYFSGSTRSYEDDIAVLELDEPLIFTEYVLPICFDYTGDFEKPLTSDSKGKVIGWGNTDNGHPSTVLKDATVPFVSQDDCLGMVSFSFRPFVSAKDKFCAGEQGPYVDRGDSGGGLIFADQRNGAWFLRGIVSVRPPDIPYLAAYTNVSYHRNYILNIKQQSELRNAQIRFWEQTLSPRLLELYSSLNV